MRLEDGPFSIFAELSVNTESLRPVFFRALQADYNRRVSLGRGHAPFSGECKFHL